MSNAGAMTKIPDDDPLMVAWKKYQESADFQNSKHWALRLTPPIEAGGRRQQEDIMPHEHRERHVEGSLWAAFMAGWTSCAADTQGEG